MRISASDAWGGLGNRLSSAWAAKVRCLVVFERRRRRPCWFKIFDERRNAFGALLWRSPWLLSGVRAR